MRHVISILLENESGALSRVAGLFSARAYNIESLSVAPTVDPTVSRMTLVTRGDDHIIEQIIKQLNKLVSVVKLQELTPVDHIEREMVLIKAEVNDKTRDHVRMMTDIFKASILSVSPSHFVIEMTGERRKSQEFIDALAPAVVVEIVRSGSQGMSLSDKPLRSN